MTRVGSNAPGQAATRAGLRAVGLALTVVGGLFALVGFGSFFSAFGSFEPPRYFWCAFVGLPLLGIGLNLLRIGYVGRIARYHAGEYTPVVRDVLNTLATETRPAQRAGRRLLREAGVTQDVVRCPECGARNREDANFCAGCGTGLGAAACPGCGAAAPAGARFCNACGGRLA